MVRKIGVVAILFLLAFNTLVAAQTKAGNLDHLKKGWVGKYPVEGKRKFVAIPEVRLRLPSLLGPKYLSRLDNLKKEPYYLMNPIELVEGHLIVDFPSNLRFNEEGDRILILLRLSDGAMHVAFIGQAGISWAHSNDKNVAPQILTKYSLPDPAKND